MQQIKAVGFDFGGVIELPSFFFQKELNHELVPLIQTLKQQGLKIGILSNYAVDLTDRLTKYNIHTLFDAVITPLEINSEKPDPQAFAVLFKRLDVLPEETIFIDDSSKSLEKAKEIGYHPILFRDNKQVRQDLQALGIQL